MLPTARVFQNELDRIFTSAQLQGKPYVDVQSGNLHRRVKGYPGNNHRMPVCCQVMKRNMKPGDQILQQLPSGQGAKVIICYNYPDNYEYFGQIDFGKFFLPYNVCWLLHAMKIKDYRILYMRNHVYCS